MSLCRKEYPLPISSFFFLSFLLYMFCDSRLGGLGTNRKRNEKTSLLTTPLSYKIGDSFFQLPLSDAQGMLSASTEKIDADVTKLEDSISELREEMQQLKVALYARFGRSINLET